ncbi:EamA family transporter [Halorussus salilacus]|uniref:DMT family transporter n=1 Tax=Halorussus salilacus TaxID=2953750 RepID=UPI00209EC04F|nr:EamA family transporter [Halorussus salilacus]USZ68547.1 EamA family transporter [Halorussus salilacus]
MISGRIRDFISRTPVLFVLLAILWGGSFVAIEVGLHHFPPLLFAGLRYAIAGAAILGYAVVAADRWRPAGRDEWLTVGIVGAFIIAGHHAFLYLGEQYVSGAIAAVVVSLTPVLTVAFAAVLLDERLTGVQATGFALGVLGVGIVAGFDPATALSTSAVGVGLVLLATASFALGGVLTRPFRSDLPLAAMQGWAMVGGAGALLAVGALRGESMATVSWTPTAAWSLVYLTLLSGVVAFGVYFLLLDRVGPTQLNLVGYLEPVTAATFGWLLLGDLIDAGTVAGFGIIFLGFALVKRRALAGVVAGLRSCGDDAGEEAWSGDVGPADD